ncbi:MAG: hypothetical protein QMD77_00420 [Patescibacteria group bacterium]|nr:hypothetical protein [Patescibacteria group bacterium]
MCENTVGAVSGKNAGDTDRLALLADFITKWRKDVVTDDEVKRFLQRKNPFIVPPPAAKPLNFEQLLSWLKKNGLESKLPGGLEKQIAGQEGFYRRFFGDNFRIDRKKITVDASRLPAIKAGLEVGCLNYALVKATPEVLSEAEARTTEAEFFFERPMKPLKNDGFQIWAETGTDRWTNLTLAELLQRGNPAEPEEFDAEAFKKDWVAEEARVILQKGPAPKVQAGAVEIIFTSDVADIPRDQKIVNKNGEIAELDDCSYVSAIAGKVRVLSREEELPLAAQLWTRDKTYLALNTWEWRRDVIPHEDKGVSPRCSGALAGSLAGGFLLGSPLAAYSGPLPPLASCPSTSGFLFF